FFCAIFSFFFFSINVLLNNILFMWLILYFLILFISYCSVHKKEHDVDHWGKFYLKRAFILLEIPNLGTFDTIL
uniref:Uncharacterized protein n=1 Tax=Scleropages formosus TaxID=113540 RepID=A0A8C9SY91_SCLFO